MLEKAIEKLQRPPVDSENGEIDISLFKQWGKKLKLLVWIKHRSNNSYRGRYKNHQSEEIHHLGPIQSGSVESTTGDLPMRRDAPRKR
jgi:hypothetical protein